MASTRDKGPRTERIPIDFWNYDHLAEVKTGDLQAVKKKWQDHCDEIREREQYANR